MKRMKNKTGIGIAIAVLFLTIIGLCPAKALGASESGDIWTAPITTKSVSVKTRRSVKRLKYASKRTYTRKKSRKRVEPVCEEISGNKRSVTERTATVTSTTRYVRGSQKVRVSVRIRTVTAKSIYLRQMATEVSAVPETAASPVENTEAIIYDGRKLGVFAPDADECLLDAFAEMGMRLIIDPTVPYRGYFSAADRSITLRAADGVVYHELGHFLAWISENAARKAEFQMIYEEEKERYTGSKRLYVTSSADEYFAESYLDFVWDRERLKKERPRTFEYLVQSLLRVTGERVGQLTRICSALWASKGY